MSFFWPTEENPDPGVLARLGRVAHWLLLVCGLLLLVLAWSQGASKDDLPVLAAIAGALAMAGRGLRYILAGE